MKKSAGHYALMHANGATWEEVLNAHAHDLVESARDTLFYLIGTDLAHEVLDYIDPMADQVFSIIAPEDK
jgi:hypothetical protein